MQEIIAGFFMVSCPMRFQCQIKERKYLDFMSNILIFSDITDNKSEFQC